MLGKLTIVIGNTDNNELKLHIKEERLHRYISTLLGWVSLNDYAVYK